MSTLEHTMEKVNYGISLKNIPPASKATVINMIIQSADTFIQKIRWRTHFYLNPPEIPNKKENYNFKSIRAPKAAADLKPFEDGILHLVQNIEFRTISNNFQKKILN